QVYYDYFHRARDYYLKRNAAQTQTKSRRRNKQTSVVNLRRDLELDALSEILYQKRFITCHSYVQSEVNMLMHVADSMAFTVNTFTHILEGYKVADKMKEHGAGGSTFSDWWAYKYEVREATPYNAALMSEQGITVAINSDDAEMGRRLNQEAAKGVKYGGMTEEEAWKMITLNPAKLLRLDDKMGSVEVGKDADIVIWNDNPLSIYAKAEKTFVDGVRYFDLEKDVRLRDEIRTERARLIQKMLKKSGGKGASPELKEKHRYHCDHIGP
ncbi:MAG: amidohydrolase family protein, partial [Flavobacteriales bacterium]|nr:amidohydrolase family protein [Flavobacteriales bacterium]